MKKMQQKSKMIHMYRIEHKLSLKPSHRDGKYQVQNSRGQQPEHKLSQWQKLYPPKTKAIKPSTKLNERRQLPLRKITQGFIN
jgi:hypothetical protein